jgi:hypothetical protein
MPIVLSSVLEAARLILQGVLQESKKARPNKYPNDFIFFFFFSKIKKRGPKASLPNNL